MTAESPKPLEKPDTGVSFTVAGWILIVLSIFPLAAGSIPDTIVATSAFLAGAINLAAGGIIRAIARLPR